MQEWLSGGSLVRGYLIGTEEKGKQSEFQEAELIVLVWGGGFPGQDKIQYKKVQEGIQNKEKCLLKKMCFIFTNSQNHWKYLDKCQNSKDFRFEKLFVFCFVFCFPLKKFF